MVNLFYAIKFYKNLLSMRDSDGSHAQAVYSS
jgi:hypothetical protein